MAVVVWFGLATALGAGDFTGSAVCADCHGEIAARQRASHHAQSLRPASATDLLTLLTSNPLRERGGAEFLYESSGTGLKAIVRLGEQQAEMPLEWAFGAGVQGMTPVGRRGGKWIEHRVSYFSKPQRPSRTVGHPGAVSRDAESALGLVQEPATITRCFGCHATAVEAGPDLSAMEPGVTCERCHGPGRAHVEAARAKRTADLARTVVNAARFPAKASVEICAGCHRLGPPTASTSKTPEVEDPVSIRFQPIGLMASRCFQKSGRLSCLTCHDPHEDVASRSSNHYRDKCLTCHATGGAKPKQCRRGQGENCVTCHMGQASPLPYLTFTDHRIRVY